jgi:hypothetical protein
MENTFDEVTSRANDSFTELREELSQRTQEIRDKMHNFVDERPLAAVGVAFGVGYLLSGALFSRATMKVAGMGGRFFLGNALRQLVLGVGGGLLADTLGRHEDGHAHESGNGNQNRHI